MQFDVDLATILSLWNERYLAKEIKGIDTFLFTWILSPLDFWYYTRALLVFVLL